MRPSIAGILGTFLGRCVGGRGTCGKLKAGVLEVFLKSAPDLFWFELKPMENIKAYQITN